MYIQVCPLTRSFSDGWLTYKAWKNTEIFVGSVVLIPFGKQQIDGIVLEIHSSLPDFDEKRIKDIIKVKYVQSFLSPDQVQLLYFISDYYFTLLHNSLSLFLPRNLKEKIKKQTVNFEVTPLEYCYKNSQKLTKIQEHKYQEILKNNATATLFYGVTGSGKTNIYIQLIKNQLDRGKQSLLLVPEIILTSQIASKISQVFWENVLVLNSSVSEAKKTKIWMQIYSWEAKVIVGTRSALFYPYKNLWIIVIDEEHDRSYQSDTNPRYDAREIALKIWEILQIPIILWSGTPSINMMYRALKKDLKLISLLDEYK